MRWRGTSIILLLFQALWLNVVLPGHTRGIVQMPQPSDASDSCCAGPKKAAEDDTSHERQERAANCAVCFFAARMTVAAAIDLRPPPLELAGEVEVGTVHSHGRVHISAYHSRGPPVA